MDGYSSVSFKYYATSIKYRLTLQRTTFVSGCPWNVVVVYLAQRLQVLSKLSPLQAGIRIIPYSALATVASSVANIASSRGRIALVYFVLAGSVCHTVGVALLSTLPRNGSFPAVAYVYEAIAGAGVGVTIGTLMLATPFVAETRDLGMFDLFRTHRYNITY